jgi:hypothetical protein
VVEKVKYGKETVEIRDTLMLYRGGPPHYREIFLPVYGLGDW